jgi:hypothetical protein
VNEEHENAIQFVESGEDSSKALQPTKQPFDLVAFFVHLLAIFPGTPAIAFGWYDGKHFKRQYQLAHFIAFIGFSMMTCVPSPPLFSRVFSSFLRSGASLAWPGDSEKVTAVLASAATL